MTHGLHVLVQQGKVLCPVSVLFFMLTPALANILFDRAFQIPLHGLCPKQNQYARDHGKSPFVIYQGAWNVMSRSFERDIIVMARSEGRSGHVLHSRLTYIHICLALMRKRGATSRQES